MDESVEIEVEKDEREEGTTTTRLLGFFFWGCGGVLIFRARISSSRFIRLEFGNTFCFGA